MKRIIKNLMAFTITILFIISGVILVYDSEENVVLYVLNDFNKNDNDDIDDIDYKAENEITDNNIINQTSINNENIENETTEAETVENERIDKETTKNEKEILLISTSSETEKNKNINYKKVFVDKNNPDVMHVIDGNYDKAFFKNSLFIGDSRVEGLKLYSNVAEAYYFATTSLDVFKLYTEPLYVEGFNNIYFEYLLGSHKFDNIFLQIGINGLGIKNSTHIKQYRKVVDTILNLNPEAKLYIVSNMHLTSTYTSKYKELTNDNINKFNDAIKEIALEKDLTYIDVNKFLDDENNGLNKEFTNDGVHLLPKYYDIEMDVFYNYAR